MGVFDRLGNLGKGMVGIMKQGSASGEERMAALEAELSSMRTKPGLTNSQKKDVDEGDKRLKQLKSLHASGLLTDTEYAEKLAALAGTKLPDPRDYLQRAQESEAAQPAAAAEPAGQDDPDFDDDEPRIKKTL
jgi:hypothetical protein